MTKLTRRELAQRALDQIRQTRLNQFAGCCEELARVLHTDPNLSPAIRMAAFSEGISVCGAVVAAHFEKVETGEHHLMIDTPELGNVWIIYQPGRETS